MDFSVIICTYNRSVHLRNVLQSLAAQETPAGLAWEIIVVDNNSTDDTEEVFENVRREFPIQLGYVQEAKQGLSYARNRGIVEARGRYVAFTDDDAIADRYWVAALYGALISSGCDCAGGRIRLKPEAELPSWLTKDMWGFLGYLDHGDESCPIDLDHPLFGGNMAFDKQIFQKAGHFNPDYGRKGGDNFGGEEYELLQRLLDVGGRGVYVPDALIHHVIGGEKLRKEYFRNLHYRAGEQVAMNEERHEGLTVCGVPLFVVPQLLRSIGRYCTRPSVRMQMNIWWYFGFIKGRAMQGRMRP